MYVGRLACNIFGVKPLKSIIYALFDGSGKLKTFFAPSECTTHTHTHIYYAAQVLVYIEPSSARSYHRAELILYIHIQFNSYIHNIYRVCVYIYIYIYDDGVEHLLQRE